jgi:hypothetical protein
MDIQGTIIGGHVELDSPVNWPNGTRVRVQLADDDLHPEPLPYDRASENAILRQSLDDAAAGRGKPAREFLKELANRHQLPLGSGE